MIPTKPGKYKLTLDINVKYEESSGYFIFQVPYKEGMNIYDYCNDWFTVDDIEGFWQGPIRETA